MLLATKNDMTNDFTKEETAMKNIAELFAREKGKKDEQGLFMYLANGMIEKFFELPRNKLSLIYELLTELEYGGWDVTIQRRHYSNFDSLLKRLITDMNNLFKNKQMSSNEMVERFVTMYRAFLFTSLNIDDFYSSVESLCNNFSKSTKKLMGMSEENLQ